jgi:glycosyltransferase involved in cell wall biosynthesis
MLQKYSGQSLLTFNDMSLKISIVIATYNSQQTLEKTLRSIAQQTYPQNQLEVLVIDGGSGDETLKIAQKFQTKILSNPKVEPGYAKFLGLITASGDYLLYVDSDETLDNPKSIELKVKFLQSHLNSIICMSQGYLIPTKTNFISKYISDFGDPFSAFMYRTSKLTTFFNKDMKRACEINYSNDEIDIFNLKKIKYMPMIEITTMGSLINLKALKKEFPELYEESHLIPHAFYMIVKKFPIVGMIKYDPISHFSSSQFSSYLGKIFISHQI